MTRDRRVLVVGAQGVLGAAVAASLGRQGVVVMPTSRRRSPGFLQLDLSSSPGSWPIPDGLTAAVICAAVTSTTECAQRPAESRLVNVEATADLARRLLGKGSSVVFVSSNQVFDGTTAFVRADAPVGPRTAYGRMKAEAERALFALNGIVTVVRLSKIVHERLPLLVEWKKRLVVGEPVRPFSDLPVSPLSVNVSADAISAAAVVGHAGTFQLSARADVSYADIALRLAAAVRRPPGLIHPVTVAESGSVVEHVPLHATLDTTRARELLGFTAPDPWQAIDEAIKALPGPP